MNILEILGIALLFLLIGYLMGKCGGRIVTQYPKSILESIKPKKPEQVCENDPYAEAMTDLPEKQGTIEHD